MRAANLSAYSVAGRYCGGISTWGFSRVDDMLVKTGVRVWVEGEPEAIDGERFHRAIAIAGSGE